MISNLIRPESGRRRGFTLIEAFVAVGLMAIVVVLVTAFPWRPRENIKRATCMSNLRQMGLGILQYCQDNNEEFPRTEVFGPHASSQLASVLTWRRAIYPYVKSEQVFACPQGERGRDSRNSLDMLSPSYDVTDTGPIQVNKALTMDAIRIPTLTIMVIEKNGDTSVSDDTGVLWDDDPGDEGWTNILFAGHKGATNYLFTDGHVKALRPFDTIADNTNRWHLDTRDPVSLRATQKLQAAEQTFPP